MKTFITILLSLCLPMAVLAQTTTYTHVSTAAALAAQSVGSTNRTATTDGATNVYDLFGMLYTYCPTCVDATNANDLSVIMPASGVGRWKAAIKPPPTGWGTADGGGNVYNVTVPTAGAVTYFPTTNPTNVLPAVDFVWDSVDGQLGIGTSNPSNAVEVVGASTIVARLAVSSSASSATAPQMQWLRTRGTPSAPEALTTNNRLGIQDFRGFDGTVEGSGAAVIATTEEAWTTTAHGTQIRWETTPTGSITRATRVTILAGGNFGIADATPVALLTVGNGDLFRVDTSGNLIRVNNVAYSWPATNALAGQILQSDASGNLSWTNGVSSVNSIVSTKTLTDNVATDVFTVALAALARSGLVVDFEIDVTNGTDTQTFTDTRRVSAVNKAGTVTSAVSASSSATATSSADTLNVTFAITTTAASYTITVTADTSLGTPTLTMRYTILNLNGASITLL